jgi:hypothetical protein
MNIIINYYFNYLLNMESVNKQIDDITKVSKCNTIGCTKDAKLRCPECVKLKIKDESYFCSKDCFKASWSVHKKVHEECKINNI